uniref:Uncharacterized protein n=2 Tax=Oryza rufipogon TaxID=4529 RepID=A0A0E0PVY7_ORYRU
MVGNPWVRVRTPKSEHTVRAEWSSIANLPSRSRSRSPPLLAPPPRRGEGRAAISIWRAEQRRGGDPAMYYRRQRKASSEANANVFMPGGPNDISFPASNRDHDWGYGGVGKEWEASYARKLQLMNFLSSLHQRTANPLVTTRMDANMDTPLEQKQKDSSAIIVLDSDDEDGYTEGCEQLTSENNKQQAPSGLTSPYTTWIVSSTKDQVNGTLHVDGVQSTQIVPYGQNAPLINQFPLQTSWQPSIQYERVILQKRPEEQRVQDLVLDTNEDMSNEKDVDDENEMDDDCNHDIRIHEDLGHVCRICGMIVRKAETIIDYQWKKD